MEIERESLKNIMRHLSECEAMLMHLRDYIKEDMQKAKEEYEDWKKVGMSDEWNKRQKYFENKLEKINREKKFYSEICKELENKNLKVEEWIFMEV